MKVLYVVRVLLHDVDVDDEILSRNKSCSDCVLAYELKDTHAHEHEVVVAIASPPAQKTCCPCRTIGDWRGRTPSDGGQHVPCRFFRCERAKVPDLVSQRQDDAVDRHAAGRAVDGRQGHGACAIHLIVGREGGHQAIDISEFFAEDVCVVAVGVAVRPCEVAFGVDEQALGFSRCFVLRHT